MRWLILGERVSVIALFLFWKGLLVGIAPGGRIDTFLKAPEQQPGECPCPTRR